MKFGLFYEHQLPKPWREGDEARLYREALEQVELADRLGFDYAWEVEHHFLDEYSHSSAPEVFLAACSQRTKRMRLGHGIVQMPPGFNHPARVAERLATLDLVSGGRVDWGTGESSAALELEAFKVPLADKRAMWREATEEAANMLAMTPYPGHTGQYFSMPCRNIVPKPIQKPHPPLWVACSRRETIELAARSGMGALTFAFVDPSEAVQWVDDYYAILARECVPLGHAVNPNIAMVTGFSCHRDAETARARGLPGFRFFGFALAHHYVFGSHQPGFTDLWQQFERVSTGDAEENTGCIGTPDQIRDKLRRFAAAGVDQVIFIQQAGRNKHEHICEALELFAREVMPEFKEHEVEREARKAERLAPHIEAAMARKPRKPALTPSDTPRVAAFGRRISQQPEKLQEQAPAILRQVTGIAKPVG
ncbi:MAG TPA: LLM class flavin-dependent oxidoreductase [Polyangiales bacterium]|nr:LLM class flavin-dependent oxidoreductase [Polyangiales bacterium]